MAKQKMKPAAIFLIIVAVIIVAVIAGGIWLGANPEKALKIAFMPNHPYAEETPDPQPNYDLADNWAALPGIPSNAVTSPMGVVSVQMIPQADVFFVHPTTYLNRKHWNAPLADTEANGLLENRVLKAQASAFNLSSLVFAPRYRQATFGAFFDSSGDGIQALSLAYTDVLAAFDNFILTRSNNRPFILAGHSQGALHLLYLLQHRITGTPLKDRLIAAYIIGWPVSVEADLAALPDISACGTPSQTGCLISYQTFGKGGNPASILGYMNATVGLNGMPRRDTHILCTNPLNWQIEASADKAANIGAIVRNDSATAPLAAPLAGLTGARCDDGILYLTDSVGDAWQQLKMAGENLHVYDYNLFYMNIRHNAALRAQAWLSNRSQL